MSKKSILEKALLQVETLEEVVKANAKGILASTMKKEITDMLKESTEEEEEISNMGDEDVSDEKDDNEMETPKDTDEPSMGDEPTDDELEPNSDETMAEPDNDTLDLRNMDNDQLIKVFKSLKPEDGVIVTKDGNDVELKTGDDEFILRLGDENGAIDEDDMNYDSPDGGLEDEEKFNFNDEEEDEEEFEFNDEEGEEEDEEGEEEDEESEEDDDEDEKSDDSFESGLDEEVDEENIYEIDLDDEDEEEPKEEDVDESARTKGFGYHGGIESKKIFKAGRKELNEQIETLKAQNSEYRKALILFKEKLNDVARFNANLAYSTRLFTENTTTKQEKFDILKRFDNVETISESKKLYETIKNELGNKKPMVESIVSKIKNTPTTSSSTEVLTESKAYENPSFNRIKDLMNKIK